ncbi:TRAP transporter substrate-binding protein [Bacillus sp. FJAT-45350]|uniref:TRAP transporter substrate-binding protein n=1 Tax=Bacillus sp. FJAT-45350 TaxID=2011014 RepID=UPI000BB73A2D|nr:TRAP transporter substrate-binding protein [Bacillus sp. FJAT-45350]
MKNKLFLSLLGFIFFIIAGCSNSEITGNSSTNDEQSGGNEAKETITLKLGHPAPPQHSYGLAATAFAEEIEQASNGRLKIEVYDSSQLGGQRELTEQIQVGTLDMGVIAAGVVSNFVDELSILDLPFLFTDLDHVYRSLDGEVGEVLTEKINNAGFVNLGIWELGFKDLRSRNTPIYSVEDMRGLKVRIQESPILVETYRSLSADPTPMDAAELYTGLQQGIVEATEGPYGSFRDLNLYEVQDYYSELNISYGAAIFLMNPRVLDSLDPDLQELVLELSAKHTQLQRQINQDAEQNAKEYVMEHGIIVVESDEIDVQSFRDATQPVYEKLGEQYIDLIEIVRNLE